MNSTVQQLNQKFPCRKNQIHQLFNIFGYPEEPLPENVYIYGGPSAGKSAIIENLLRKLNRKFAVINLIECYTSRLLFEGILNKLTEHEIDPCKGQPYARCDNMMDFILHLQNYSNKENLDGAIIILHKAEQLRQMDVNLLPGFLRMRELSGMALTVVLISEIIFEKYYFRSNVVVPIKVHFPQYNLDELLSILVLDFNVSRQFLANYFRIEIFDYDVDFYKRYINVFLSVFYRACRDLSELRYMCKLNFTKYCQPIIKGDCTVIDSMYLWRHISPILKCSLTVLYLRVAAEQTTETFSKEKVAISLELPYYSKYLLIAAYLASYNPAKEDKRLFMKYHGKKTKTMRDVKSRSKVHEALNAQLGPKAFSLDRLLAIFYSILDDKVGFNNNLLVQVSSLVELQLLTSLSDSFSLDGQKYKCNVNFEFIFTIAKMVSFNIQKYLFDFL